MNRQFFRSVCAIAIPVSLQSMLQATFSGVDQIMIGQLGSDYVAAVGFGGKFASIFLVMVTTVATVAGILVAQYLGQRAKEAVKHTMLVNLALAGVLAVLFMAAGLLFPTAIMGLYTDDPGTCQIAAEYLSVLSLGCIPTAGTVVLSVLFRCMERADFPLFSGITAALLNTGLNYLLIFGKGGFPALGAKGAAAATVVSQAANMVILLVLTFVCRESRELAACRGKIHFAWRQYTGILVPLLIGDLLWILGENVYAGIYGHLGTAASAAMTLTYPLQGMLIGILRGLSQAAAVIVGKQLGEMHFDRSYRSAERLLVYGGFGCMFLAAVLMLARPFYLELYQVEPEVKRLTTQILIAYVLVVFFKVQNMIMGGILQSGGKTNLTFRIGLIGTWGIGVPLGLISGFVWNLSIPYVYFILSLVECVRYAACLVVFRKKQWMVTIK